MVSRKQVFSPSRIYHHAHMMLHFIAFAMFYSPIKLIFSISSCRRRSASRLAGSFSQKRRQAWLSTPATFSTMRIDKIWRILQNRCGQLPFAQAFFNPCPFFRALLTKSLQLVKDGAASPRCSFFQDCSCPKHSSGAHRPLITRVKKFQLSASRHITPSK